MTATTAIHNMLRSLNPALLHEEKRQALQLEQFRCFDFSSMGTELRQLFPNNHTRIRLRHVPLAHRVGLDGAGPYDLSPVREHPGATPPVAERWRQVYRQLNVDELLLELEQAGVLQQSYVIGLWPDGRGQLRLHGFLPYEVASIRFDDPLSPRDNIADATEVVLTKTIARPDVMGRISPWVSLLRLTREEAWQILPDGQQIGLYSEDGVNPLGVLPLVATRRVRPVFSESSRVFATDGGFLPTIAQDVLSCQIGLVLGLSHIEYTTRSQTHNKVMASGEDAGDLPGVVEDRPDGVLLFPADVTVQALQLDPPVEKYIRALETTVYYLSQYRYLRPEAYAASIVTGSARRADALGFTAQQRRQETRCRRLEYELKRLIALGYNATAGTALKLDPDSEMAVTYRHVKSDENVLQEQQARAVKIQNLMGSVVEDIAKEEGITADQARKLAMARMEDLARFMRPAGGSTPGLDKLAPEQAPTVPEDLSADHDQAEGDDLERA